MSLDRSLVNHGHVHRFFVTRDRDGWEVHEEEDSAVLTRVLRTDWHRVERDALLFQIRSVALERDGWNVIEPERETHTREHAHR